MTSATGSTTDTHSCQELVYTGHGVACMRLVREPGRTVDRYAIVRLIDQAVLGELRWSGKGRCYVLLPQPQTVWTSGVLSLIGVWLRRLTRNFLNLPTAEAGGFQTPPRGGSRGPFQPQRNN
jgi:hypothetical protein